MLYRKFGSYREGAGELFDFADHIIVNEGELANFCGVAGSPCQADEIAAMARSLRGRPDQKVIVTRGARGSVTITGVEAVFTPAPVIDVLDTTGAGDCFCGYVAAGLAAQKGLDDAVTTAHGAAAIAVGRLGAASSIPHISELNRGG